MLCENCTGGNCIDCPTENLPAEIACTNCEELGCSSCDYTGYFKLTSCPKQFVDSDLVRKFTFIDMAKNGHLPIAGGVLDQSHWFIRFYNIYEMERNKAEAELFKK